MSFIGMGVYGALRRIGLGFVTAGLLGGGVLVLYTLMIGAGVSSLRALIMFLVRIGADMTGRDYDLPTVYYDENVPLFRRNGYRKSGTMILRVRSRDTALN